MDDDDTPPGIRRLCVAYRIESPRGCGRNEKTEAERRGAKAFRDVCASLGLERILLDRHAAGHVGVLPVGIDEPRVVSSLVEQLPRPLADLNVRCRLAFHEGVTSLAAGGFGGNAVAKARRCGKPAAAGRAGRASASQPGRAAVGPGVRGDRSQAAVDQFRPVDITLPRPKPARHRLDLRSHSAVGRSVAAACADRSAQAETAAPDVVELVHAESVGPAALVVWTTAERSRRGPQFPLPKRRPRIGRGVHWG